MKTLLRIAALLVIIFLGYSFFSKEENKKIFTENVLVKNFTNAKDDFLKNEKFAFPIDLDYVKNYSSKENEVKEPEYEDTSSNLSDFEKSLHDVAMSLTKDKVVYDPMYFSIPYPMGDVPEDRGVCTDVVIRAYRKLGIDLQELVHKDMQENFSLYPNKWGLTAPDSNIDHRRVPNLMVFFSRFGKVKSITENKEDYLPGDIVAWDLGGGITHIGIVSANKSKSSGNYLIVHNIGAGQVLEDILFKFKIIGHYFYHLENFQKVN